MQTVAMLNIIIVSKDGDHNSELQVMEHGEENEKLKSRTSYTFEILLHPTSHNGKNSRKLKGAFSDFILSDMIIVKAKASRSEGSSRKR